VMTHICNGGWIVDRCGLGWDSVRCGARTTGPGMVAMCEETLREVAGEFIATVAVRVESQWCRDVMPMV
jgi:hypothetical protein